MTKKSKTVVFFGSGPVAAKSLELLLKHTVVEAIITKPTTLSEMSCIDAEIPTFGVSNVTELNDLIDSSKFTSQLGVLIDFGIIVSQKVIDSFDLGIVNSHFSMLPELRGADPITFSILSGQETTGVSLMLLVDKMDEGPILAQSPYKIPKGCNTPELTQSLIELSDSSLKSILPLYFDGLAKPLSQSEIIESTGKTPTYSRKLTKDDGIIDWSKPAEQIEREIRAYAGWPRSRSKLADKDVIVTTSHLYKSSGEPGQVIVSNKHLVVACGKDALEIDSLQPAGKKEMPASAFLAGYGKLL